jgi:ParB-like chromosome segregation protein Spo0J
MSDKKLKIEYMEIDKIIPYVNNTRTHSQEQITQIASSIKEFGFNNPILIDENNGIIAGHGRLEAGKKLGLEKVPVVRLVGLTEAQRKAYIIADNKIALNAGWDEELLRVELESLQDMNFDLDLLGFNEDELNEIFKDDEIYDNNKKNSEKGEIEITQELKEEHNYIVLKFDNVEDWLYLKTLYPLKTVKAPRREQAGIGRVVNGIDFIEKIKKG